MNRTLIAIDPGTHESAVVEWDGMKVTNPRILPNDALKEWLKNQAPGVHVALEMVACYGMPVGAETFETCLFVGRLQEVCEQKGMPAELIYRKTVKIHLCGSMKAKDSNIRQALIDRFGIVGTKKNQGPLYGIAKHLWAALAVAVYSYDNSVGQAH